jgi:hypothetical protein
MWHTAAAAIAWLAAALFTVAYGIVAMIFIHPIERTIY